MNNTADYIKSVMLKNGKADYISIEEYANIAESGSKAIKKMTQHKLSDLDKSDKTVMLIISLGHMILSLLAHGSKFDKIIEDECYKTIEVFLKLSDFEWKGGDIDKLLEDLVEDANSLDMDRLSIEKYKLSIVAFGIFLRLSKEEPSHSVCMEVYGMLNDLLEVI